VQLEEFGGDVPCVEVSGLTGLGLDKLVETLSTLAEVKELRARRTGRAEGRVLESRVDKGRGCGVEFISTISRVLTLGYCSCFLSSPVTTVLVTQGCLEAGTYLIAGTTWARVRQMIDSSGAPVRSATPGFPVTISGWKELPQAGDEVLEGSEDEVKNAIHNRKRNLAIRALQEDVALINEKRMEAKDIAREAAASGSRMPSPSQASPVASNAADPSLLGPAEDHVKELRLIVKGDVSGSVEAVVGAVGSIGNHIARVRIIQAAAGEPTEADVDMAKAVNGELFMASFCHTTLTLNLF
jgi:translation initiation factor IF-2